MKSTKRQAVTVAGILALSLVGTAVHAQARAMQSGGAPNPDTKSILITALRSPDPKVGVETADELRRRLQSEHSAKELFVTLKQNIDNTLSASGYKPDSALSASDLMELAKQLRADYVIDGNVTKSGTSYHLVARLLTKTGTQTLVQPLPPLDGKDAGDVAKMAERAITEVVKSMPAYTTCIGDLRAAKYADAEKQARLGIAAYPTSTFNRLCLLNAYNNEKASPDSIIALSNGILAIDPTSMIALSNLADAYQAKGDTANVIATNIRIWNADRTNTGIIASIINTLANSGAPDKAIQMIDTLLKDNPADTAMLGTKWRLQLKAKNYKAAMATGEEIVKIEPAFATLDYYNRQIGSAQADSNTVGVQVMAAKAAAKFPTDISFPLLLAQSYYKTNQFKESLEWAQKALAIDPKNVGAYQFALASANSLGQADVVASLAQKAIVAGVDKSVVGGYLLGPTAAAFKKAQESKSPEDWKAALAAAEGVDKIAPTKESKFYVGVMSFQLAQDYVNQAQGLMKSTKKADRETVCEDAKQAEDLLATTSIAMPAGGATNPATASQILGAVGQYAPFIAEMKKTYCKP